MKKMLALLAAALLARSASANIYNVTGTADGSGSLSGGPTIFSATTLRAAVNAANLAAPGPHTINLAAGTYTVTSELPVGPASGGLTVTFSGAGSATTIIQHDLTSPVARVLDLDPSILGNVNVAFQNLTIAHGRNSDGTGGAGIICGNQTPPDTTTVTSCVLLDNQSLGTAGAGGGIENVGGNLSVINSTFIGNTAGSTTNGGGGIYTTAESGNSLAVSGSAFFGNQATGTAAGGGAIYKDGSATLAVTGCNFSTNQVLGSSSTLNAASGGAVNVNGGAATIQYCRFFANTTAAANKGSALFAASGNGATATANNNWWASNTGPGSGVFTAGNGAGTVSSWLELRHSANPSAIAQNGSSTLTAGFLTNSLGAAIAAGNLGALVGLPVTFNNAIKGTLSGAQASIQASATATAAFNAGSIPGSASADAIVDGVVVTAPITILCPTITAGLTGSTNICAGNAAVLTVTLSGGLAPYTVTLNNGGGTRTGSSPLSFTNYPAATTTYAIGSAADANGCAGTSSGSATVTVNAVPASPAIFASPGALCSGSAGNQAASVTSASAYSWTISNGTITSATNLQTITYTAGGPGSTTLNLTVFNASGCSAAASTNVPVTASVITVANAGDSGPGSLRQALLDVCPGGTILFAPGLSGQTITLTSGQLTLTNSVTIDASGLPGGISISGGGDLRVFNVISNAIVSFNSLVIRDGYPPANGQNGGGIQSQGNLTLNACTLTNNGVSGSGGGICIVGGVATLNECTVSGNAANAWGLTGKSGGIGGGIYNPGSTLTLNQCTIAENVAYGTTGGGGIAFGTGGGTVALNQCTVSQNTAANFGGGIYQSGGSLVVSNSIVAADTQSSGYDITNASGTATFTGVNLTNGNPLLASLGNYGGPTKTLPPLPGSPAIDGCTNGTSFAKDQRGLPRVVGAYADLGAVEGVYNPAMSLLSPVYLGNGSFQFGFSNLSGPSYTVLAGTNVAAPINTWSNLGAPLEAPAGAFQFTDTQAANYLQRFYRVKGP